MRRQRVASLRARGLTHEEIWQQLALPTLPPDGRLNPAYMVNPKTGQPYDRTQITRDLQWLREENLRLASDAMEQVKADALAEVRELKRAAWSSKKYDIVLRCLEREAKLQGLDKPAGVDITSGGEKITLTWANANDNPTETP